MIFLKLLHFAALICWCGSLLYMPALIAAAARRPDEREGVLLERAVFTLLATPAALLAIASGSALFLQQGSFGPWLVLKLGLVSLLVCLHALCGVLILRTESEAPTPLAHGRHCLLVGAACSLLIGGILWTVLAKPGGGWA